MADATYFHSTLYRFEGNAFNEVIRRFKTNVPDVTAKCYYDTDQDIFCLTCPAAISQQGVEMIFGDVISDYITEELAKADREDARSDRQQVLSGTNLSQRPAKVRRFPASCVEDVSVLTEPTSPSGKDRHQQSGGSFVLHSVQLQPMNGSPCVKLLRINQLPDGFVERTLPSSEPAAGKAMHFGLTCRVVRWDAEKREYVFNGRVGCPISIRESPVTHIFNSTTFLPLTDQRSLASTPAKGQDWAPTTTWKFKNEKERPSIQRFLEGTYETEPDELEQPPEIPADAKRFLAHSTLPAAGSARTRVVKRALGVLGDSDDEGSDDSSDNESVAAASQSFAGLLIGAKVANTTNGANSTPLDDSEEETTPTFASLFDKTKAQPGAMGPPSQPAQAASAQFNMDIEPASGELSRASKDATPKTTIKTPSVQDNASFTQVGEFPIYPRSYATVDTTGLTSSAANYAAWQHENMAPHSKKKKTSESGISRREVPTQSSYSTSRIPTSGSSAALSLSTGSELQQLQPYPTPPSVSSSVLGSTTIQHSAVAHGNAKTWSKEVIRDKASPRKLIDDTSVQSGAKVKLPPGLGPPPGLGYDSAWLAQARQNNLPQTSVDIRSDSMSMSQSIKTFSNFDSAGSTSTVRLPPTGVHKPMRQTNRANNLSASTNASISDCDYAIVERLQQQPIEAPIKKDTMRQQKGKGGKNTLKKTKTGNTAVQLPMPNPVPPHKKRPTGPAGRTSSTSQVNVSKIATEPSKAPGKAKNIQPRLPSSNGNGDAANPVSAVEKLLKDVAVRTDVNEVEVIVRLGLVLVHHPSLKDFHKDVLSKEGLQTKVQQAANALQTTFITRLTTSPIDAQYLLERLPGDGVIATVGYEIHIKNSEGCLKVIKFDQAAVQDFIVVNGESTLGTLYLHYSVHVWDAEVTVNKPELDDSLMTSAGTFISSMQTTGDAPSFLAAVPPTSFAIDKVYAKRVFAKPLSEGVEWRVTEVRDLILGPHHSQDYNFVATAQVDEAMVETQRLWWECALHAKGAGLTNAKELQGYVDDIVSDIDGVGFDNKGPWVKTKVEEPQESSAGSDQILW